MHFESLPISCLQESPFNPRKHFDPAKLDELASTITQVGIQQPIKVRPLAQTDIEHTHEIVFGHRRFRAARIAGLTEVPVIIEEMSDEQARIVQMIENIQREDTNPIEEAQALQELKNLGVTVPDLIKETGKKKSYIYNTLKLTRLTGEAREACMSGQLDAELAKLIAALPPSVHTAAYRKCMTNEWHLGERIERVMTFRPAKHVLENQFMVDLSEAPFPRDDARFCQGLGLPACTECGKCSANDPAMLDELGPGTCLDKDCYDSKVTAQNAHWVQAKRDEGLLLVVEGNEAASAVQNYGEGRYPLPSESFTAYLMGAWGSMNYLAAIEEMKADGENVPMSALVIDPKTGLGSERLLPTSAKLIRAYIQAKHKPAQAGAAEGGSTPQTAAQAHTGADVPVRSPEEEAVFGYHSWQRIKRAIMAKAIEGERTTEQLRYIALTVYELEDEIPDHVAELMGWSVDEINDLPYGEEPVWFSAKLLTMSPDQIGQLLTLYALNRFPFNDHSAQDMLDAKLALAARYGVDVLALQAKVLNEAGDAGDRDDAEDDLDGEDA